MNQKTILSLKKYTILEAITTIKKVSQISNSAKFDSLKIVENGLLLKYGKKLPSAILFSEIDTIYIKVYQSRFRHISILIPVTLAFLYFEYAQLDITMFMAFSPVIPLLVKTNYFRRFALVIRLKEGTFFRKNISVKTKFKTIELLNAVKKEMQHATDTKKAFQFRTNQKITFPTFQ